MTFLLKISNRNWGIAQYIGKDMSYEATTKRLSFELRNIGGTESLNQNNYVSLSYTTSKDNNILYLGGSASGVSIIDTENITLKEKNIYLSKLLEHEENKIIEFNINELINTLSIGDSINFRLDITTDKKNTDGTDAALWNAQFIKQMKIRMV